MVDISHKEPTERRAVAQGRVTFTPNAYSQIRQHGVGKGDILLIAQLAGISGAKKTADLIPLCHPLLLNCVKVDVTYNDADNAIEVSAEVRTAGRTGVEMEALTAVSIACLSIYDMAKSVDKAMLIEGIELVKKTGGKSGDFNRSER